MELMHRAISQDSPSITVRAGHLAFDPEAHFSRLPIAFISFATDFGPLTYGDDDLLPPDVSCALRSVQFIAKHTKDTDREIEVIEDWKFVAMVLDRFFLWVFIVACFAGTAAIILEAPSLYDQTIPLDHLSHAYIPPHSNSGGASVIYNKLS